MKIKAAFLNQKIIISLMLTLMFIFQSCSKSDSVTESIIDETTEELIVEETVDLTHLPFGGSKILRKDKGDTQPALGSLWLCGVPANGAGASDASDWTNSDGTWDYTRKPVVEGNVSWVSEFNVILDGNGKRIITGNALPDHPTGVFPIDPTSVAYQYDRNMNEIKSRTILFEFDATPEEATNPSCVTYGAVGISLTGSVIYHGASTLGNDAAAHEILDRFGGHSDGTETYHYHYATEDLQDHIHTDENGHSPLMGYMIDGFGIYGPKGEDGQILWTSDLDENHGHKHPVLWDGEMVNLYHYHWTYDFPYNIGAFKGTPQ